GVSIWTNDLRRAHRMAGKIEAGMIWVNSWFLRDLRTPFGGMKDSGIGRVGGMLSFDFFTELSNDCIELYRMIKLTEKMTRVIENYSHILFDAENSKQEVPPLTEGTPNLTVQDAYQIQLTNVQKKVEEGNYITGKKIGLTSLAMQESLGVSE